MTLRCQPELVVAVRRLKPTGVDGVGVVVVVVFWLVGGVTIVWTVVFTVPVIEVTGDCAAVVVVLVTGALVPAIGVPLVPVVGFLVPVVPLVPPVPLVPLLPLPPLLPLLPVPGEDVLTAPLPPQLEPVAGAVLVGAPLLPAPAPEVVPPDGLPLV